MEALWSARQQSVADPLHIVCVVDGDSDANLARLLTSFAAVHKTYCSVYWRRNGGLSAARNSAIEIALSRFANLRAVFFLDADNRLSPDALNQALDRIDRGEADILYPDLLNFGLRSSQDTAGRFSFAALLRGNYIDAGSLVSARVLHSGLRFDETLREGYEDWAFWLSAARAGFRLAHDAKLGLQYRRRPESMLANTGRNSARLRTMVEARNYDLFAGKRRRIIDALDEPHFALVHIDRDFVEFSSDLKPRADRIDLAECGRRLHLHRAASTWVHFPPLICFAASRTIEVLRENGVLPGLLWRLSIEGAGAACQIVSDEGSGAGLICTTGGPAHVRLVSRSALAAAMQTCELPHAKLTTLAMTLPEDKVANEGIDETVETIIVAWMDMKLAAAANIPWSWRGSVEPRLPPADPGVVLPVVPDGQWHVGFVHAEAACCPGLQDAAKHLIAAGFVPHLITGGAVPAKLLRTFETTSLLPPLPEKGASPDRDRFYFGANLDRHCPGSLSAFGWLDAMVAFPLAASLDFLGELRAGGTATIMVLDRQSSVHEDDDLPYLIAAYEHGIDVLIVDSDAVPWLAALGVPRSKIMVNERLSFSATLVTAVERCLAKKRKHGASVS